ncbi:MAG: nucleoid-associated protein [Bacteroidia bacterium]
MIDLSQARLTTLAVHRVGNKMRREGVTAAKALFDLDESMSIILQDYFLHPFKAEEFFQFAHETDLNLNEVYTYCRNIFTLSREEFLTQSVNILQHLYAVSVHPHIKQGELYVAHFRECIVDGTPLEAVGIFKSENKDVFLKIDGNDEAVAVTAEQGINVKRLDKGCLVFNTFQDDGFSLLMVDKSSEDAQYWRDDFLHVARLHDNGYHTAAFMELTRDFCDEVFAREQDKKEQVVFLNKSLNYFNKNKEFDLDGFKEEVIGNEEYRDQFDDFRKVYEEQNALPPAEEGFPISRYAVRNMRRQFRSLIKLDSHVEIKLDPKHIDDASEYVERGFDDHRGMFYYKIYFDEELE